MTQSHIPENFNLQHQHCENLKACQNLETRKKFCRLLWHWQCSWCTFGEGKLGWMFMWNMRPNKAFWQRSLKKGKHLEYCYMTQWAVLKCYKNTQLLHQPLHIHKIFIKFTPLNIKNAPTCFGPKTIIRELYIPCWSHTRNSHRLISLYQLGIVAACCVV